MLLYLVTYEVFGCDASYYTGERKATVFDLSKPGNALPFPEIRE